MKKILFATVVAVAALVSCTPKDEPEKVVVSANLTASSSFTDGAAKATVTLSAALESAVTVELGVAKDSQLGADVVTIEPATATIAAGETSAAFTVKLGEAEEGEYTVKVEIVAVSDPVVKGENTVASIKATVEGEALMVVDMHNYKLNSTFFWGANAVSTGSNYTFEWKFYPYEWHNYGQKNEEEGCTEYCNRLGQVCNEDEKGILIRYGDGGANGSLRVNGSKYFNDNGDLSYLGHKTEAWELNKWHTLTITVDTDSLTVYDNGELWGKLGVNADQQNGFPFERLSLSMEWGYDANGLDYPLGQDFHGYIEYIRFWKKTLTQEEVKAGLCKVAKNAEGLESLWIFNTDSGTVVPDQVGPRDIDFTKAYVWYSARKGEAPYAAEAILEQWKDWDVEANGPMCPEL